MSSRLLERARALTLGAFVLRPECRHILLVRVPLGADELADGLRRAFGEGVPPVSERPTIVDFETAMTEISALGTDLDAFRFGQRELRDWISEGQCFPVPLVERSGERDGRILLGRSRSADLSLRRGGISKRHAIFEEDSEGALWVEDSGSRNGTKVDGEPLMAGERVELRRGGHLTFGSIEALYCSAELFWAVAQEPASHP